MKKALIKLSVCALVVGCLWMGLSRVGSTLAYFNDIETSDQNSLGAGSLDFSLRSDQTNFIPPIKMNPGSSVMRDIYITKEGSLPLQYSAISDPVSGSCDFDFYNVLELQIWYSYYSDDPVPQPVMILKYDGLLKDFDMNTLSGDSDLQIPNGNDYVNNVFYGPHEHHLFFQITYPASAPAMTGLSCQFDFVFDAWQDNLNPGSGFSDTERIGSMLIDGEPEDESNELSESSDIVLDSDIDVPGDEPLDEEPEEDPVVLDEDFETETGDPEEDPVEVEETEEMTEEGTDEGETEDDDSELEMPDDSGEIIESDEPDEPMIIETSEDEDNSSDDEDNNTSEDDE